MNIALHLRREVLNYKVCIETCTCHPKRWTCCNIDARKNIKNKAVFVYYSEIWHLAQYVWTQTSIRPGRMTNSSPVYKEMEFHIIRSSFVILLLGFPISFIVVYFSYFITSLCKFTLSLFILSYFASSSLSSAHHLPFPSSDSSYYRDRSFPSSCFTCPSSSIFLFRLSLLRFFFLSRQCIFVAPYHDTSCHSLLSFSSRLCSLSTVITCNIAVAFPEPFTCQIISRTLFGAYTLFLFCAKRS